MVPIEERSTYLNKIQQIPKIRLFYNLLIGKCVNIDEEGIDIGYAKFVNSLMQNNKQIFNEQYENFARKRPSNESLWINDDFLIFILIIGIVRYNIDREWIRSAIKARTTQKAEHLSINTTFLNILNENFQSKDNLYEIIIVFQNILNLSISTENLDDLYNKISNNYALFLSQNDFLICLSMKSMDIIVVSKGLPNSREIANLRSFSFLFQKRVDLISKIIYILILLVIVVFIILYWNKYNELLNSTSMVLGLFGAGLLAFVKWIQGIIKTTLLYIGGYSEIFLKEKEMNND